MTRRSVSPTRIALFVLLAACARASLASGQVKSSRDSVLYDFQVDQQATIATYKAPAYPAMLRSAGVEGWVLAQFVVRTDSTADMRTVKILRSDHDLFTQAVRDALPAYRFAPATKGGVTVPQLVQMPFSFGLAGSPGPGALAQARMPEARTRPAAEAPFGGANAATLAAFHFDVPFPEDPGECVVGHSPQKGLIVGVFYPSAADRRVVTSVWLDSLGGYIRYTETRHTEPMFTTPVRSRAALDSAVRASDSTRNSMFAVEFSRGFAMLMNRGGGRPRESISVPIALLDKDPRFGAMQEHARRIVERCGTTITPRIRP